MTIDKYADEYMPAMGGWCSAPKARKIHQYITQRNLKRSLEIGVFAGRSLCAMGIAAKEIGGSVTGIDPYTYQAAADDENQVNKDWWQKINYEEVYKETLRHLHGLEIHDTVYVGRYTSRGYFHSNLYSVGGIDFLHIDGNHSEWNSTHDVCMWVPEVRQGGVICMDDMDWESTATARRLLAKQAQFLEFVDENEHNCAFFQKL